MLQMCVHWGVHTDVTARVPLDCHRAGSGHASQQLLLVPCWSCWRVHVHGPFSPGAVPGGPGISCTCGSCIIMSSDDQEQCSFSVEEWEWVSLWLLAQLGTWGWVVETCMVVVGSSPVPSPVDGRSVDAQRAPSQVLLSVA
eukprot:jgi/Ulvmu1/9208/UM005_0308.1